MNSLTIMSIFILMFILSPFTIRSQPGVNLPLRIQLPQTSGPEDIAFDPRLQGPYTGVADGRVLKFVNGKFMDFASTSPFRTKEKCDGTNDQNLLSTCGRPLGIDFDHRTGDLYIVDVMYGLLKVGPNGGLATQLAAGVDGKNFSFADSVVVDKLTQNIYFVDSGDIFRSLNFTKIVQSGDTSGRLIKYNMTTGQVTVVLTGLSGPSGMAMNIDHTFIMISEYISRRIIKYYIRGPKANMTEVVFEKLEGHPDNVKRSETIGGFWVAVNIPKQHQLQPPQPIPMTESIALKFDANGNILRTRNVTNSFPNTFSVYLEYIGKAYTGSLVSNFIGVYVAV